MARVLICSQNNALIEKCSEALSKQHDINLTSEFSPESKAEVVILDTELVDDDTRVLTYVKNHSAHILLTGTQWPEEKQVEAMLYLASGYYDQTEPEFLLQKAVNNILNGDVWINRHMVPKVIHRFIDKKKTQPNNQDDLPTISEILRALSSRELDVAKLVSQGENNKQIASKLFISERTVKAHLTSIFRKLNVSDRLHLAVLLREKD